MAAFTFPVPGLPTDLAAARAGRKPFSLAADGRLYRPHVQVLVAPRRASPAAVRPAVWALAHLDTGADCCLFGESLAELIGIPRPSAAPSAPLRTVAGTLTAWFADVRLHLGYPRDPNQFDWDVVVGFVPDAAIPGGYKGVFGIGGGLEVFDRIELCLSPTGGEMPVVRLWTRS